LEQRNPFCEQALLFFVHEPNIGEGAKMNEANLKAALHRQKRRYGRIYSA